MNRAAEICRALDLEFYIGPPRGGGSGTAPAAVSAPTAPAPREIADLLDLPETASVAEVVAAIETRLKDAGDLDADALRDAVAAVVEAKTESLRDELAAARKVTERIEASVADLSDASALAGPANDVDPPGARQVDVVELDAAAGGGAAVLSEEVTGRVWFRRDWLNAHTLDPTHCAVIGVRGCSMEPILPDGCSILIDRARTDWRVGRILLLRTSDGLIVKRAGQDADGKPTLVSEHPKWDPVPLPGDAEILGRVVWTARTLPDPP